MGKGERGAGGGIGGVMGSPSSIDRTNPTTKTDAPQRTGMPVGGGVGMIPSFGGPSPEATQKFTGNEGRDIGMSQPGMRSPGGTPNFNEGGGPVMGTGYGATPDFWQRIMQMIQTRGGRGGF